MYTNLLKNIGYFFAGSFGSKLIAFLLVPYYTYTLSTDQYGTVDLISITAAMLVPIFTLSIVEAVFRLVMDKNSNWTAIFTNGLVILIIGNIVLLLFYPILNSIDTMEPYVFLFYALTFMDGLYALVGQFVRGIGETKKYAIGGFIQTITLLLFNILFLQYYQMAVRGYLLAFIFSFIVSTIYYILSVKIYRYIGEFDSTQLSIMLVYSIPMIPSGLSWWAMASLDKYVVTAFMGVAANGIFLVAQKLPTILNVFNTIFFQAWQISAVEVSKEKNGSNFETIVFFHLMLAMFLVTSAVIVGIKVFFRIWVAPEYYIAWEYTPLLLLATVYACFAKFMGTYYLVSKKTIGNFKTTMLGGIVNFLFNLFFVPIFGLYAASMGTLIGYVVTFFWTVIDTIHFSSIKIDWKRMFLSTVIIILQGGGLYLQEYFMWQTILFLLHVMIYFDSIKKIYIRIHIFAQHNSFNWRAK